MTSISELNWAHQGSAFMPGLYVSYIYIRKCLSILVTTLPIISENTFTYRKITSGVQNDLQRVNWIDKSPINVFGGSLSNLCFDGSSWSRFRARSTIDLDSKRLIIVGTQCRKSLFNKMNYVSQLDEEYAKLIQQGEDVTGREASKGLSRTFISVVEAKKENSFAVVEEQTKKLLESLTTHNIEIKREIGLIKTLIVG